MFHQPPSPLPYPVQIVLFEDELAAQLDPICTARPAFTMNCGGYRLLDFAAQLGPVCTLVRKHLQAVEAADAPQRVPPEKLLAATAVFLNARLAPSVGVFQTLKAMVSAGQEGVVTSGGHIAAALVQRRSVELPHDDVPRAIAARLQSLELPTIAADLPLIEYPHDLLRHHLQCCRESLEYRIAAGGYREISDGVFVAENVTLGEHLVTDTRGGPIVIDRDAVIGPFCFLRGPVYLGARARLNEHAAIKDNVVLGHTTKAGGEVEASVLEPFTNKQHHGFLGHSYLGSWVNLGAGTSNSDLKNTYGTVNVEYRGKKTATGMQFVGSFIGDYAKTAVNTGIFTGKTIGVCSMVYGFVTTNVPAFCNYARTFGQVTDLPAEVMIATQGRMFARRKVPQRPCDVQLIHDLYALARLERQLSDEPLSL
jgi:UDP-N-acetylglucosamine diphosphorylase / glucose-1-phosphate thymidylyltransferase / UDP-N-acetylgalactosamine diphosphorylase / glucosamine-1-phosphate N-acetyltransferase / galactosamine-1-phosphate N-acetyltransferase